MLNSIESNVIIPKGINRHPFADVLHEWIEGAELHKIHDRVRSFYTLC